MHGRLRGERDQKGGSRISNRTAWIVVAVFTVIGILFRLKTNGASLFADELSTLWMVRGNGLGEVLDRVSSDAEITPPLYFVLAWLATKLGSNPDLIRLPALLAGIATIPLTYLIGIRTIGRRAALLGTAAMALSPFMVYYSANARGYSVGILFLMASTLAMLLALEDGRKRWWAAYAAFACLAMYSHYTMAFVLIGQLIWLLWRRPEARRIALAATLAAAVFYLPWIPGLLADGSSITTPILEFLQGDGFRAKRKAIELLLFFRLELGTWHVIDRVDVWLVTIGLLGAALTAVTTSLLRGTRPALPGSRADGLLLVVIISLSTLVGEALLLLAGTDIFGARNLAATWAGLPLLIGALLSLNGFAANLVFSVLALSGLLLGTVRVADSDRSGVAYEATARLLDRTTGPGDVIVDASHVSPSPLANLEVYLTDRIQYQPGMPEDTPDFIEKLHEPNPTQSEVDKAFAHPGPVTVVTLGNPDLVSQSKFPFVYSSMRVPPGWRITGQQVVAGVADIVVITYEREGRKRGGGE